MEEDYFMFRSFCDMLKGNEILELKDKLYKALESFNKHFNIRYIRKGNITVDIGTNERFRIIVNRKYISLDFHFILRNDPRDTVKFVKDSIDHIEAKYIN